MTSRDLWSCRLSCCPLVEFVTIEQSGRVNGTTPALGWICCEEQLLPSDSGNTADMSEDNWQLIVQTGPWWRLCTSHVWSSYLHKKKNLLLFLLSHFASFIHHGVHDQRVTDISLVYRGHILWVFFGTCFVFVPLGTSTISFSCLDGLSRIILKCRNEWHLT